MSGTKKNIKSMAKQAKNRLKSGFWEEYQRSVFHNVECAEEKGLNTSNVINFCKAKVIHDISDKNESDEHFYSRVKEILDSDGCCSDIVGRLCDETYMKTLSFADRQRYVLETATRYLECLSRYNREKSFSMLA